MPVTLPQLSRREFLKRAALAGVGAGLAELVPPKSYAGLFGKSRDPHTFFLISDTHIAGDSAQIHLNVNMADHFTACVCELAAWPVKPAAIIVNGDLAFEFGSSEEYAMFGKLLAPVRALAPVHLSLGNHDEREHFWKAFPRDAATSATVPRKQLSVFASDRANWFLLDSLDFTLRTPGALGEAQLKWLARELDLRPRKPAIVAVHHNPQFLKVTNGLLDSVALLDVLATRHQVKALIFGHTHDWHVEQHECGIHLINLPPTSYPFQEGRPSGWVCATLARDGMKIELRSLNTNHPEHAQVKQLAWRV